MGKLLKSSVILFAPTNSLKECINFYHSSSVNFYVFPWPGTLGGDSSPSIPARNLTQRGFCYLKIITCLIIIFVSLFLLKKCWKRNHLASSYFSRYYVVSLTYLKKFPDESKRKRLCTFENQIKSRPMVLSACRIFTIDASLIYSFIGTIATYTVILYQMKSM